MEEIRERVVAWLAESHRVLVFTGAGISTGSGIRDFRGPAGIWKTRQPVYFHEFLASEDKRVEHWQYKLETFEEFRHARPNAAHTALVELEKMGKLELLVTQNIDGLHQDAGTSREKMVEVHGTNRAVECLECGARTPPEPAFEVFKATGRCPRCPCGGLLKTATISFGQSMPEAPMERAFAAAMRADLALSLGSTLEVEPAASVPATAARQGVRYVIINRGPTAHDRLANVRLEGDVTELLPAIVEGLKQKVGP